MLTRGGLTALAGCLAASLLLAGCESDAHQDTLNVTGHAGAQLLPTNSVQHAFRPRGGEAPDSAIAYTSPGSPSFPDHPLDDNLNGSVELADYTAALKKTGLFARVARSGPFTVFAIPNEAMEHYFRDVPPAQLFSPQSMPATTRLMAYTIVQGRWTEARLRKVILRSKARAVALRTLSGDSLTARVEPSTSEIVLNNARGQVNRLWVRDVAQSNGTLFLTQSVLPPG